MAQSAKLFVFEERADVTIEQTRSIPIELARTGRVGLTQTEISKLIGRLFIERTAVNLHSELLDAPEFLWEDDQWEPLYKQIYTRVPRARARARARALSRLVSTRRSSPQVPRHPGARLAAQPAHRHHARAPRRATDADGQRPRVEGVCEREPRARSLFPRERRRLSSLRLRLTRRSRRPRSSSGSSSGSS